MKNHVSCATFHVLPVTCRVSPVTCNQSLTPAAPATDPPSANSPIMHSRQFCKDPKQIQRAKNHRYYKNPQMSRGMPKLTICSSTRAVQSTRKRVFGNGTHKHTHRRLTDIATYRLNRPRGPILVCFLMKLHGSKLLYQAIESSLVPFHLLTVQLLQKTYIYEAFVIVQC